MERTNLMQITCSALALVNILIKLKLPKEFDERIFFLEADNVGACQYDQGSPVVQVAGNGKNYVVGIYSKTNKGCGLATYSPRIYTKLSAYYTWLVSLKKSQKF